MCFRPVGLLPLKKVDEKPDSLNLIQSNIRLSYTITNMTYIYVWITNLK